MLPRRNHSGTDPTEQTRPPLDGTGPNPRVYDVYGAAGAEGRTQEADIVRDETTDAVGLIRLLEDERGVVLLLRGEIDSFAVQEYERSTPPDATPPVVTVVDAADVTFLDSQGVSFLVRQTRHTRGAGRLPRLPGPSTPALRVLELTGLTVLFDLE